MKIKIMPRGKTRQDPRPSILLVCFFFFLFPPLPAGWGYSDEIAVPIDEVWQAATHVLSPRGIRKADAKKREIETQWVEDQAVRASGLLKRYASRVVRRRHRVKVKLIEGANATQVILKGNFQIKSLDTPPGVPWESAKPQSGDYDVERDAFMKILKKIETDRQNRSKPSG